MTRTSQRFYAPVDPPAGGAAVVVAPAEVKPVEVTPAEVKPGEVKPVEAPVSKAPDKYALTIPEGGRLDEQDVKYIETIARGANWTNEEAQAAIVEQDAAIKAQSERFRAETNADPIYGGDHLAESEKLVKAAILRIRPEGHARRDSFLRFMNRGGAGNHIEVVSFLADLGKLMAEDSPGALRGGGGAVKDIADRLYDKTPSKPAAS